MHGHPDEIFGFIIYCLLRTGLVIHIPVLVAKYGGIKYNQFAFNYNTHARTPKRLPNKLLTQNLGVG